MKQVGLFHPYKRKYRRIISTFRLLFIHTRSTVAGSAVMSGIRIAFSTCRSGAIDLSGGTLSAFDPLGILFGRQNRLHPAGHLFTLLCHRFTRFFSHLPAFGPVLPHGLSLFQANRVNLFYLFVRERQVFFHPVGHLFATCSVVSSLCSARRLWCPFWAHTVPVASTSVASTTIKNFAFISTTILIVIGLYNRMYSCKPSANLFRQMEKTTYSSLNHEAYSW